MKREPCPESHALDSRSAALMEIAGSVAADALADRARPRGRGSHRRRETTGLPGVALPGVLVVGGVLGGVGAVGALARAPVEVTLIDRRNHQLFQPLLYQVATGSLDSCDIAEPLRSLFRRLYGCNRAETALSLNLETLNVTKGDVPRVLLL